MALTRSSGYAAGAKMKWEHLFDAMGPEEFGKVANDRDWYARNIEAAVSAMRTMLDVGDRGVQAYLDGFRIGVADALAAAVSKKRGEFADHALELVSQRRLLFYVQVVDSAYARIVRAFDRADVAVRDIPLTAVLPWRQRGGIMPRPRREWWMVAVYGPMWCAVRSGIWHRYAHLGNRAQQPVHSMVFQRHPVLGPIEDTCYSVGDSIAAAIWDHLTWEESLVERFDRDMWFGEHAINILSMLGGGERLRWGDDNVIDDWCSRKHTRRQRRRW